MLHTTNEAEAGGVNCLTHCSLLARVKLLQISSNNDAGNGNDDHDDDDDDDDDNSDDDDVVEVVPHKKKKMDDVLRVQIIRWVRRTLARSVRYLPDERDEEEKQVLVDIVTYACKRVGWIEETRIKEKWATAQWAVEQSLNIVNSDVKIGMTRVFHDSRGALWFGSVLVASMCGRLYC